MSVKWTTRIWRESQVGGRPLIVLLALGHMADNGGELGITAQDLQHRCRLNRQQLDGCLEQLTATRHISVKGPDVLQGRLYITLFPGRTWTLTRPS